MNEISTCQNTHTWSKDRGSNETIYISSIEQQTKNRLNHFSILNNNKTKLWWAQHHPMCLLVVTLWIIHLSNLTFLMQRDQAIQTSSQRHCYPGFCPPNYSCKYKGKISSWRDGTLFHRNYCHENIHEYNSRTQSQCIKYRIISESEVAIPITLLKKFSSTCLKHQLCSQARGQCSQHQVTRLVS